MADLAVLGVQAHYAIVPGRCFLLWLLFCLPFQSLSVLLAIKERVIHPDDAGMRDALHHLDLVDDTDVPLSRDRLLHLHLFQSHDTLQLLGALTHNGVALDGFVYRSVGALSEDALDLKVR